MDKNKKIEINNALGKEYVRVEFEAECDDVKKMSFIASDKQMILAALMYMVTEYCDEFNFSKEKMLQAVECAFECCDDEIEEDDEEEEEEFPKIGMFEISGERAKKFIEFLKDINPGKHSKEKGDK